MPDMKDEEVLIAFMPYLKGDNTEAMVIHELYQKQSDQKSFVSAARDFLAREEERKKTGGMPPPSSKPVGNNSVPGVNRSAAPIPQIPSAQPMTPHNSVSAAWSQGGGQAGLPQKGSMPMDPTNVNDMASLEQNMASLLADDDDPVVSMPNRQQNPTNAGSAFGRAPNGMPGNTITSILGPPPSSRPMNQPGQLPPGQLPGQQNFRFGSQNDQRPLPITPPRNNNGFPPGPAAPGSPLSSLFPASNQNINNSHLPFLQQPKQPLMPPGRPAHTNGWEQKNPPGILEANSRSPPPPNQTPEKTGVNDASAMQTPPPNANANSDPPKSTRKEYQPKRLWTQLDQQPGKILANDVPNHFMGNVLDLRPRQELKAQWMLPLGFLRNRAAEKDMEVTSLRDLLKGLAVGLFRRGCTENGSQASIVSKEVLTPVGESRSDYPFRLIQNDMVVGTVPFYSPRTPGHVVFRLYWHDEPLHTLATGPTLNVRVRENDFEATIRFILSNFKGKKVNPTSLSSLNSLALVLEHFSLTPHMSPQSAQQKLDGSGRAVWGCICEARKVVDACASEHQKTIVKLEKMEEGVEELKAIVETEQEEKEQEGGDADAEEADKEPEEPTEKELELKEKLRALMSGRASCERKWRDSQLAFSSILRAIVTNPMLGMVLRRELITKMKLEYELWCPLCEEFAVPGEAEGQMWYEPLRDMPNTVTAEHFRVCSEARSKMQQRILGFDPNPSTMEQVLYPGRGRNRPMDPGAVNVFNQLSSAMGKLYQDVYQTADRILRQRELIRSQTERFVDISECFPPGTKVAVFGSSANGFGSPKSDLDMCLQIPDGAQLTSEEDPTGSTLMSKLAEVLEKNGMQEVDISRLTARIPVIKFNCPKPPETVAEGEEPLMECDLSMRNPLAVLNTSLLRTYAEINPVPRVLAAVIKRWAKARDINNPARHTLSSYGYILMLLHFLTFHERSGNGLVLSLTNGKSNPSPSLPLIPNLQRMDASWPEQPPGTPYKEYTSMPKRQIKHPLVDGAIVNTFFYRPNPALLNNLRRLFPGQDLSLGILLASFFRYYAFEFDYKRHVVSLHSNGLHGVVEREVKAELDGWRNYSAALTIEDPFETFYDVAHVLRGGYYHRIRREFAVAYSKIADIAAGKTTGTWNGKTVDLAQMSGMELIDWICEPIPDKEEGSTA